MSLSYGRLGFSDVVERGGRADLNNNREIKLQSCVGNCMPRYCVIGLWVMLSHRGSISTCNLHLGKEEVQWG